jgi:hypothetical protein
MKRSKAAKRSRKVAKKKRTKPDDKEAATNFVPAAVPQVAPCPVSAPEPKPVAATEPQDQPIPSSARSEATPRTADGKFSKSAFAAIGGIECPCFAAMTWKERDKYMSKPENSAVRERYKTHMASAGK